MRNSIFLMILIVGIFMLSMSAGIVSAVQPTTKDLHWGYRGIGMYGYGRGIGMYGFGGYPYYNTWGLNAYPYAYPYAYPNIYYRSMYYPYRTAWW